VQSFYCSFNSFKINDALDSNEIVNNQNHSRVVTILKANKANTSDINEKIKALGFYNERIKFIKKGLDQQQIRYKL
jgi:flagellar biosynthesis regulator FlaF